MATPKLQLTIEQPLTGECWIPPKKNTPHPRTKGKPQQDSRRAEITFRTKPHARQRCSEGSNKTLCTPGPWGLTRDWARPAFECLSVSCWGTGQQWPVTGMGLSLQQTWRHGVWAPPQSHWADNPQTGKQLYQRSSCTVVKVLGPRRDFPIWWSGKGNENLWRIWLWRPVGFDYRTSTGLGKQTLGDQKQNLCASGPRRKEQ